jgi:branched-chain amino acid transport system substrate-binding protein
MENSGPQRTLNVLLAMFLVLSVVFGVVLITSLDDRTELIPASGNPNPDLVAGAAAAGSGAAAEASPDQVAAPGGSGPASVSGSRPSGSGAVPSPRTAAVSGGVGVAAGGGSGGVAAGGAGAGGADPTTGREASAAAGTGGITTGITEQTIRIGSAITASGPAPFPDVVKAVSAAVSHINDTGGINGRAVEWIWYDDQLDPNKTVTNVRRLIDQDRVFALVGNFSVGMEKALPFIEERGVPTVAGSSIWPGEYRSPMVWNPIPALRFAQVVQCEKALQVFPDTKKAGIIYLDGAATIEAEAAARRCLEEHGIDVKSEKVSVAQPDFTSTVLSMRDRDLIFPLAENKSQVRLYQAMDRQGFDPNISGNAATNDRAIASLKSKAVEGALVPSTLAPLHDPSNPAIAKMRDIVNRYQSGAFDDLTFFAEQAYVGIMMFAEVARDLGPGLSRESLAAALNSLDGRVFADGLTPPLRYLDPKAHSTSPVCVAFFRKTTEGFGPPTPFECR